MNTLMPTMEVLDQHVRGVASAAKASELFKRLLEGAQSVVPNAAVFLVRQGTIKGWGAVGYPEGVSDRLRQFNAAVDSGWLGQVAGSEGASLVPCPAGAAPDFGQSAGAETIAIPVSVRGQTLAIVLAQRGAAGAPWHPEFLSLLARVGQLRLELDLAARKLAARNSSATAPATAAPSPTTPSRPAPEAPVAATDNEEITAAKRFARLVATDIRLYNEEAVMLGRRNGDLEQRLSEHLVRGKETFVRRHGDLGTAGLEILRDAYVQVLAAGDRKLLSGAVFGN